MSKQSTSISSLFGSFVIRANALQRLNLFDVYWVLLRHALGHGIKFCPLTNGAGSFRWKASLPMRPHTSTAAAPRSWIVTEADLSRTTIFA